MKIGNGSKGALSLVASLALACSLPNPSYSSMSSGSSTGNSTSEASTSSTGGSTAEASCPGNRCTYIDPLPIACYEFEMLDTLIDDSECGHNGIISNVTPAPGVHGVGARIDYTSEISVGGTWPELPSLTFSLWVALQQPVSSEPLVLLRKKQQFGLRLTPPTGPNESWNVNCKIGGNISMKVPMKELTHDGSWHLVGCGCLEGAVPEKCAEVFVFVDEHRETRSDFSDDKPLMIAADLEIAKEFEGCIDSVQIWDRALTSTETAALLIAGEPSDDPCN